MAVSSTKMNLIAAGTTATFLGTCAALYFFYPDIPRAIPISGLALVLGILAWAILKRS